MAEQRVISVELHVPDFGLAESAYGALGFTLVRSEPSYRVLSDGTSLLAFYGGDETVAGHSHFKQFSADTPRGYGVELILFREPIDEWHAKLECGLEFQIVAALQTRPWGARDFRVVDPFGFYWRITGPYDPSKAPA